MRGSSSSLLPGECRALSSSACAASASAPAPPASQPQLTTSRTDRWPPSLARDGCGDRACFACGSRSDRENSGTAPRTLGVVHLGPPATTIADAAAVAATTMLRFAPEHEHSGFPELMMGGLSAVLLDCAARRLCKEQLASNTLPRLEFVSMDFLKGVPCLAEGAEQRDTHVVQALARLRGAASYGHRMQVQAELQDREQSVAYARASLVFVDGTATAASPAVANVPTSFALIDSPLATASDRWVSVADPLSVHIPSYNCFGCGSCNTSGFRAKYEVNTRTGSLRSWITPPHGATLQGAMALVPVDCIAAWCVMLHHQHLALTSRMEALFLAPLPVATAASSSPSQPRVLAQGQVVSFTGRQATVIVNLWDYSSSAPSPPRLCLTARLTFTLASESIVTRLLGERYLVGVRAAMQCFTEAREALDRDNAARGLPPVRRTPQEAKRARL